MAFPFSVSNIAYLPTGFKEIFKKDDVSLPRSFLHLRFTLAGIEKAENANTPESVRTYPPKRALEDSNPRPFGP